MRALELTLHLGATPRPRQGLFNIVLATRPDLASLRLRVGDVLAPAASLLRNCALPGDALLALVIPGYTLACLEGELGRLPCGMQHDGAPGASSDAGSALRPHPHHRRHCRAAAAAAIFAVRGCSGSYCCSVSATHPSRPGTVACQPGLRRSAVILHWRLSPDLAIADPEGGKHTVQQLVSLRLLFQPQAARQGNTGVYQGSG